MQQNKGKQLRVPTHTYKQPSFKTFSIIMCNLKESLCHSKEWRRWSVCSLTDRRSKQYREWQEAHTTWYILQRSPTSLRLKRKQLLHAEIKKIRKNGCKQRTFSTTKFLFGSFSITSTNLSTVFLSR